MRGFLVAVCLLAGCASTKEQPRFKEPLRTQFVVMCGMRMPVTHCLCVEQRFIKKYGTIEEALKADADELQLEHDFCGKKLRKEIERELDEYNENFVKENTF